MFILLLTFHFLLVLLFVLLFHRIVPRPELVDMRTVPALQTMHFYAISVVGCHLELYNPCLYAQQVRVCGGFLFVIPGMPCGTLLYVRVRFGLGS